MDFDEYEYLEKTVENPLLENEVGNGGDEKAKSEVKERRRSSRHRSDEKRDEDEDGRRSKRSRSRHRSRSRDRERDRHRSSREHRDKDRDRDHEKSRDKEERNGKERERDKDRDRDSKGRDHEKDRERDRSRRSRSRSERRRSQEREKSQEVEPKERETKDRDRDRRRKKEDKVEPEADPERDQRTVFAYQIALRATERDVYEFFSRAGKVRDVRIIMDRISRRSRGIGYVEFYDTMSVPMAIALSGQPLLGQPVMVKPSEAEKNLVQSTTAAGAGGMLGPYSGGARRLYVGNLHINMSEDDLRKVFEPFGSVELVQVPRDETGLCKGFGFVQFARLEDARNALNLNGQLEIVGRAIKVSAVTDQTEVPDAGQTQATGDLDDDDGGGLSLNAQSRALLMQKLDRSGTASSTGLTTAASIHGGVSTISPLANPAVAGLVGAGIIPGVNIPAAIDPVGVPSECLLLKNMFDPSTETEPHFDEDIKEDVKEECSKFGELNHIYVDKYSIGFVYLRFENVKAAMGAQHALHGRWFAGKMITATYMTTEAYEAKFPESKVD
ncbi:PREDICTED: RNA-binding protein 39 [Camelina sativa]|uniref:RNA-binding protein 39 n=1 Tax=Camelina sativa TaxID=90675 RepID=A0ABM1RDD8_CAMSA|nr:PREDICTED: RNA-binding protein 39 [Camelina sativa]